jgi:hypothetical protein
MLGYFSLPCKVGEYSLTTRIPPYHDFIHIWQLSYHSCEPFSGNCCVETLMLFQLRSTGRPIHKSGESGDKIKIDRPKLGVRLCQYCGRKWFMLVLIAGSCCPASFR